MPCRILSFRLILFRQLDEFDRYQRETKVFVISNAPIFVDWDVEQFTASELFDLRQPLRKDAADRYSIYLEAAKACWHQAIGSQISKFVTD